MQHSDVSNNQCYFLFFLVEKSENLACLMNQSTLISVVAQYLRYFRKFCGHRQLKLRVRSQKLHFFFRDSHCESHIRCVLVKYENENVKNTNLMISDMYICQKSYISRCTVQCTTYFMCILINVDLDAQRGKCCNFFKVRDHLYIT